MAIAVAERPSRADGLELIGEYKDSGLREPPYLVRRRDGQMVQLTRLAYLVAEAADGRRDLATIAERVTAGFGRDVSAENVAYLVERKLGPAGIVIPSSGAPPELPRAEGAFALTMRGAVIPPAVVRGVAAALRPFFWPGVVGAALAWLAVIDVWLFGVHGLGRGLHDLFARPALALLVLALVLLSAAFHECGHAAACRYGGARPGAMGVGLYLAWPVFYTDVTDAYRLSKGGRVRTDLGGVYFNVLFILATAGVYFQTRFELLLVVIAIEHATMIQQLAPWFRLDGYYVITDLTGVPDVLSRTRPVLRSLLPGRRPDPRVQELKPWVRGVVTAYVVTLVPALAFFYALLVLGAPRFFAAAARGLRLQADHASVAWHAHDASALALAALQFLGFAVPALGMSVLLAVLARRVALVVRRRVRLRGIVVFAAGAAAAVLAIAWWNSAPDVPAATPAKSHVPTRHRAHVVQRAVPAPVHRTEARNVRAPAATTASRPRTSTPPPTTRSVTTTRQRPASQPPASAAPTTTTAEPAPTTTTASTIPTDTTPTTTTEATMTTTTTDTTPTTTTTTTTTTP